MNRKLILISLIVAPTYLFAWGKEGHQLVAQIAKQNMNDSAKARVQRYLGNMSFEEASTWMDDIKRDKENDYMKPWHYVNIEPESEYKHDSLSDITFELNRAIRNLQNHKNLSTEEVNRNLKIVFHLCGDIVQPLHVGYAHDKGGNDIKLDYRGKQSNLHKVWDSEIIVSEKINTQDCLMLLTELSVKKRKAICKIHVNSWMTDSRKLLKKAYKLNDGKIDEQYISKNKKVIEMQLAKGGLRLAEVLNEAFGK